MVLGKVYEKNQFTESHSNSCDGRVISADSIIIDPICFLMVNAAFCLARELGPSRFAYVINEGDVEELYTTAAGRGSAGLFPRKLR